MLVSDRLCSLPVPRGVRYRNDFCSPALHVVIRIIRWKTHCMTNSTTSVARVFPTTLKSISSRERDAVTKQCRRSPKHVLQVCTPCRDVTKKLLFNKLCSEEVVGKAGQGQDGYNI
jgi:hypothetical protein